MIEGRKILVTPGHNVLFFEWSGDRNDWFLVLQRQKVLIISGLLTEILIFKGPGQKILFFSGPGTQNIEF